MLSAQHTGQTYIIFSTSISSEAACQLNRFLERVGERVQFDSQTAVFTAHPTAFPCLGGYLCSLPGSSESIALISHASVCLKHCRCTNSLWLSVVEGADMHWFVESCPSPEISGRKSILTRRWEKNFSFWSSLPSKNGVLRKKRFLQNCGSKT